MKGFDLVQGLDVTETQLRDRWGWKKWQWMLIWADVNIFIFKSKIWDVKKKTMSGMQHWRPQHCLYTEIIM